MALKVKKKESGGANWMDTYGDMVTLLLCFFVLLYSMSSISEENWRKIVMSFNPDATPVQTEIEEGNAGGVSADPENSGSVPLGELLTQEDVQAALEEIYNAMESYSAANEMAANIDSTIGDGYVFVSFNDAVFFNPDSYQLTDDGEAVLDVMAQALSSVQECIDEVRVMGHTAQGQADRVNRTVVDRMLSAERAAMAGAYIQEHSGLDGARVVTEGYGQWRPVDSNESSETRAHNRRVEVLITGFDVESLLGDSIEQYYTTREGEAHMTTSGAEDAAGTDTGSG